MSDTVNAADRNAGRIKKNKIGREGIKAFISLSTIGVCLVAFLFGNVFSKNQEDVGFRFGIKGYELLGLLSGEGSYQTPEPLNFSYSVTVTYPMFITYFGLFCVVILALLAAVSFVRYFLIKNEILNKTIGWAMIFSGIIFVSAYIALMFIKTSVTDLYGEEKYFYNLFEVKPTLLIISILLAGAGAIDLKLKPETVPMVKRFLPIYGFMVVPLILIFVFNLYPIVLQTVLSFKDFKLETGVWGGNWVGFKQFGLIFTDPKMLGVIGRTLYISILRLIVGIIPPLILSVCLYDLKSKTARSVFQSIVYIPHFFSWVVVYAITYSLFSPEGLISSMFGTGVSYLASEKHFMPIVIFTAVWKELGWGTILYLAALSGVDTTLFEAAKIDGASPLQRVRHITLPSIKNTIIFLTVMSLGNILKGAGGEQLLLFSTATTRNQALVIDTWLIWDGMNKMQYSLGAAMSFFQSAIGMLLVLVCNRISQKTAEVGMW